MAKFKFTGAGIARFDYQGAEKILEPGEIYDLEQNDYIEGLIAFGLLVPKAEKVKEEPIK